MEINKHVKDVLRDALNEFDKSAPPVNLRSCSAKVFETPNYYILRSYFTLIAVVSKHNGNLYDALRLVYGYTSTSCQHVRKFRQDYSTGETFTYR